MNRTKTKGRRLAAALLPLALGCGRDPGATVDASRPAADAQPTDVPVPASAPASVSATASAASATQRPEVVLIAGGDIDLSRRTGQRILREPSLDPFVAMRPLLESADLRFANLESQLCDLDGRTGSPDNPLVFAGPPSGADVLARGRFDIVSTANNHAWDFGLRCLRETIDNVRRVGIVHVGTDADGKDPGRPQLLERNGQRFAFFAVTAIFNQGRLREHEAKDYIADADMGALARRIAHVRERVDWVIVSVHVGEEYMHVPINATRYALFGAVDAGADVVLGHHTHTPQRVELYSGKPVVMSLGNLVFHENSSHPWTGWGYLARVTFAKSARPRLEVCPYHLFDAAPQPLTDSQHAAFTAHWDRISMSPHALKRRERTSEGCFGLGDET